MTSPSFLRKILISTGIGGLIGLGFGCVITAGGGTDECDCVACHSVVVQNSDGTEGCECEPGYDWSQPNDPNNFDCDANDGPKPGTSNCTESYHVQSGDQCACTDGFAFCTTDPDDLECCAIEPDTTGVTDPTAGTGTDPDTGTGADESTGGGGVCDTSPPAGNGVEPAAEDCTPELAGNALFCSNTAAEGPAGGRYYECTESGWVEMPNVATESCQFDGFEFAIGCIDDGAAIQFACGDGPGTDCSGAACDACADSDVLNFCENSKLHAVGCSQFCQDVGIDGVTFESGFCDVDPTDGLPTCQCCDSGEKNCPV
jgi:hypothetical protein